MRTEKHRIISLRNQHYRKVKFIESLIVMTFDEHVNLSDHAIALLAVKD